MNNEKDSNKLVTIKEKIVTAVKENKKGLLQLRYL